MNWQQADGLVPALPLGLRRIDALRTLTTDGGIIVINPEAEYSPTIERLVGEVVNISATSCEEARKT